MFAQAKEQGLRYLLAAMRSETEIRRYLQRKAYEEDVIDEVIAFMYNYNYLDDGAYAMMYVRDKITFHPSGRIKLRYALEQKGVASEHIVLALEECYPRELEIEQAQQLANKRMRLGHLPEKVKRYLYGRGFSYDIISSVIFSAEYDDF